MANPFSPITYPRSLCLMVQFFRFLGISNGFLEPKNPQTNFQLVDVNFVDNLNNCNKWKWILISFMYLILYVILYIRRMVLSRFVLRNLFDDNYISGNDPTIQIHFLPQFIMESIILLAKLDNFINFFYFNYWSGQRLIKHLSDIGVLNVDQDCRLAIRIIVNLTIWLIFTNVLASLAPAVFIDRADSAHNIWTLVLRGLMIDVMFLPSAYQCCIYTYSMLIYCRQIQKIRQRYKLLTSKHLIRIKRDLFELQQHYNQTRKLMEMPMFLSIFINTWTVVAFPGICINLNLYNIKITYLTAFTLIQSSLKLLTMVYFGQLPYNEMNRLIWGLRHRIICWNQINWLCLLRIELFKDKFRFRVFSLFTIDHGMLITLTVLIITYLLLLEQIGTIVVQIEPQLAYDGFFDELID